MLRPIDFAWAGLAAAVLAVVFIGLGSSILGSSDTELRVNVWSLSRENSLRAAFPGGRWQGNVWVRCEPDKGSSYGRQSRYIEDGRVVQTNVLCWDIAKGVAE